MERYNRVIFMIIGASFLLYLLFLPFDIYQLRSQLISPQEELEPRPKTGEISTDTLVVP